MPDSQDVDIGRSTGIYPLPDALSPYMRATMAMNAAVREMDELPRSTPDNSEPMLEAKYQYLVPKQLQRRVGDDEYDEMVRHNALIRRLQGIDRQNPEGYREAFINRSGVAALAPTDLRKADRPPVRYKPTMPIGTPRNPIAEGLRWWDSTTSGFWNAARMAMGDETAAEDFAKNADTFLMRVPTFLKHGSFSPGYDEYLRAVGETPFYDPGYMATGRADYIPYSEDAGATGGGDFLVQAGVPEGTATDIAGLLLDGFVDPDGGAVRAARAFGGGRLGKAIEGLLWDNALPGTLYGGARAMGSGPMSSNPRSELP